MDGGSTWEAVTAVVLSVPLVKVTVFSASGWPVLASASISLDRKKRKAIFDLVQRG
jgi:hypothetical protein